MISEKSSLVDKIEYYIEYPEDENRLKDIFTVEERDILDIMDKFVQLKLTAPQKKARDVNEEVEIFLEGVDREKEISLCLKQKIIRQLDILLGKGSTEAWMEIITWYQILKHKGIIVDSYWEFPILADMIKIFKEETQSMDNNEISVLSLHSMKELTEVYFRMVFMVRRMAYGVEVNDEIVDYKAGKKLFPVFIKVLAEDNDIEIHDRENILDGLSGWRK